MFSVTAFGTPLGSAAHANTFYCAADFANQHSMEAGVKNLTGIDNAVTSALLGNDAATIANFTRGNPQLIYDKLTGFAMDKVVKSANALPNVFAAKRFVIAVNSSGQAYAKATKFPSIAGSLAGRSLLRYASKGLLLWTIIKAAYDGGFYAAGLVAGCPE